MPTRELPSIRFPFRFTVIIASELALLIVKGHAETISAWWLRWPYSDFLVDLDAKGERFANIATPCELKSEAGTGWTGRIGKPSWLRSRKPRSGAAASFAFVALVFSMPKHRIYIEAS